MESLAQNGSQFGQQTDPNMILNRCRDIRNQIDQAGRFCQELDMLRRRLDKDVDQSAITTDLAIISGEAKQTFKGIIDELTKLKRNPEAGNPMNKTQISAQSRRMKTVMQEYERKEMDFKHAVRDQMRREYRIINENASEEEVAAAVPDAEPQQMFQQALMTSNRQGQANTTLNAVRQRNEAIKKIERDIIEVAELFSQMENLVVQQEAAVVNIEQKGEEVVENMDKGVEQINTAIVSARSRNRKKWWCLGICGMSPSVFIRKLITNITPQFSLSSLLSSLFSFTNSSFKTTAAATTTRAQNDLLSPIPPLQLLFPAQNIHQLPTNWLSQVWNGRVKSWSLQVYHGREREPLSPVRCSTRSLSNQLFENGESSSHKLGKDQQHICIKEPRICWHIRAPLLSCFLCLFSV
jgi:t-SNARE complex subunit (syntaxin)